VRWGGAFGASLDVCAMPLVRSSQRRLCAPRRPSALTGQQIVLRPSPRRIVRDLLRFAGTSSGHRLLEDGRRSSRVPEPEIKNAAISQSAQMDNSPWWSAQVCCGISDYPEMKDTNARCLASECERVEGKSASASSGFLQSNVICISMNEPRLFLR
jgi:hypothetical protein